MIAPSLAPPRDLNRKVLLYFLYLSLTLENNHQHWNTSFVIENGFEPSAVLFRHDLFSSLDIASEVLFKEMR